MSEYKDSAEQIVDDFAKDQQEFELQNMLATANNVVTGFVASTGATGLIPIPFADAPLLIAQQVAMMGAINAVFHITVGKDILKSLAMAAIGVSGATVIRKTAATLTLALGKAYIGVCKSIKMGDLNLDELSQKKGREAFKQAFRDEMKKKK